MFTILNVMQEVVSTLIMYILKMERLMLLLMMMKNGMLRLLVFILAMIPMKQTLIVVSEMDICISKIGGGIIRGIVYL